MNELLNQMPCHTFRETINSSPIFSKGDLKGKYNLVCAVMDRIDTCVAYLNAHNNYPDSEEEFIVFFVFGAMLRDAVQELLACIYNKKASEITSNSNLFHESYVRSSIFNPDKDIPTDDKLFEYMRSLVFAHPIETSRAKFLKNGETQYSPWVIVNPAVRTWCNYSDGVGIRIYSSVTDKIHNLVFPLKALHDYLKEWYGKIVLATKWAENEIEKKQNEWLKQKINRSADTINILTQIKQIEEDRFESTDEIDDLIRYLCCPVSNPANKKSVSLYREAIVKSIPAICNGIERLDRVYDIPAYRFLTDDPKMTSAESYQLIQVYSFVEGCKYGNNMGYELLYAKLFSQGFAKKWVDFDPYSTPPDEIVLLARTACYLELQEQKHGI